MESSLQDAAKVSGALRAVACMTRPWHTPDHPTLDMTHRADLADLLDVLSEALAGHTGQLDQLLMEVRATPPDTVY